MSFYLCPSVYENGQLDAEGVCKDGERDGEWKEYDENGNLKP